jgi:hypothetical protein
MAASATAVAVLAESPLGTDSQPAIVTTARCGGNLGDNDAKTVLGAADARDATEATFRRWVSSLADAEYDRLQFHWIVYIVVTVSTPIKSIRPPACIAREESDIWRWVRAKKLKQRQVLVRTVSRHPTTRDYTQPVLYHMHTLATHRDPSVVDRDSVVGRDSRAKDRSVMSPAVDQGSSKEDKATKGGPVGGEATKDGPVGAQGTCQDDGKATKDGPVVAQGTCRDDVESRVSHTPAFCIVRSLNVVNVACLAALHSLDVRRGYDMESLALDGICIFEDLAVACASACPGDMGTQAPHRGRCFPKDRPEDVTDPIFVGIVNLGKAPLNGALGIDTLSALISDVRRRVQTERTQIVLLGLDPLQERTKEASAGAIRVLRAAYKEIETMHRAMFKL